MTAGPGKVLGLDVGRHIGYCLEFPEDAGRAPVLGCAVICPANAPEPRLRDGATAWLDRFLAEDAAIRALGPEDTVVIERQLRQNERCRRLEQHLVSYFYFRFPDQAQRPRIVVQSARLKGFCHGAPKGCKGPDLKRWAVETVEQILRARGLPGLPLPVSLDSGSGSSRVDKREDAADAYLTVSAFKVTGGGRVNMPPTRRRRGKGRGGSKTPTQKREKKKERAAAKEGKGRGRRTAGRGRGRGHSTT